MSSLLPITAEARAYAAQLDEREMTAMIVEIRRVLKLYREQRGQLDREDRDSLVVTIDDLDRYLCAGAPLPGEWCSSGGAVGSWEPGADVADDLAAAARAVERSQYAQQERRAAVRRALDAGMSPTTAARLSGMTRTAIYQIRDETPRE